MSQRHLNDLRNALERRRWRIVDEQPGDDYQIAATWLIQRPDGSHATHIDFECMPELEPQPIEKAIGCTVRENRKIEAYFARIERTWPVELEEFIGDLAAWAK
ncbi:MAG: hypothetical protein AAF351_13500 [Pseudomonadota bacterium]